MAVDPGQIPTNSALAIGLAADPDAEDLLFAGDTFDQEIEWLQCNDDETAEEPVDFSGWIPVGLVLDAAGNTLAQATVTPNPGDAMGKFRIVVNADDTLANPGSHTLVLRIGQTAQVVSVSIDGTTDGQFAVTINGQPAPFPASSNTATEIRDGLVVAINGLGEPVTAAPGAGDTLDVTGDDPGVPFTLSTSHDTATGQISSTVTTPAVRNTLVCVPFVVTAK